MARLSLDGRGEERTTGARMEGRDADFRVIEKIFPGPKTGEGEDKKREVKIKTGSLFIYVLVLIMT